MQRKMSKQIAITLGDEGMDALRGLVDDFDENAGDRRRRQGQSLQHFVSEAVLVATMRQILENDKVVSLDDKDSEILMSVYEKLEGNNELDGVAAVIADTLKQIAESGLVTCEGCGGDAFSGTFFSRYSETEWVSNFSSEPICGDPCKIEEAADAAWSTLIDGLNAEEWEGCLHEYEDGERIAMMVETQVTCASCGDPIELAAELFPSTPLGMAAPGAPKWVVAPWLPSLETREGCGVQNKDEVDHEGGIPCPICHAGRIEMIGEAVFLRDSGGKQSGVIEFKGASRNESPLTWGSRLDWEDYNEQGAEDEEQHHAEMGFRAGVTCSTDECWEARGLNSFTDIPSAILAAAALASAYRSFSDLEPLDLAVIAKGLGADTAGLAVAARTWLNSASNDAKACGVAKEMLGN